MKKISPMLCAVFFLPVVCLLSAQLAHAETLSLQEAMRLAVENNPNMQTAGYEVDARLDEQHSVRGRFLPVVRASANILYWDDAASSDMDLSAITGILGDMAPLLPASSQEKLAKLKSNSPSIQVHDQLTYKASVTVSQPLIQLYGIYFSHEAAGEMAQAASYDQKSARLQLELEIARTYYGLLAATGMKDSLKQALGQIEVYETQVKAFLDTGRVELNALMKVDVQRADLQRALFAADKAIQLAKARLNMLMGRPQETKFEAESIRLNISEDSPDFPDATYLSFMDHAIANRPDILSIRQTTNASRSRRQAAISAMLPELNAVFNYDYNGGMGAMQPENQYFVGLTLNWNIWEWGASYYQVRASEARMSQAASRLDAQTEQTRLEVRSRKLDLDEAIHGYGVALAQREQAMENLRVETARYHAEQTTTADLLQAQTLDVRSANDLVQAEVKVLESRQSLLVASGYDLLDAELRSSQREPARHVFNPNR